jgi:hypothetical protein
MDEEEEEEEEEEDDDEEEEEESEEEVSAATRDAFFLRADASFFQEESFADIDPSAIQSRRTRGVKVDYTSAEALAKGRVFFSVSLSSSLTPPSAGLTAKDVAGDDDDDEDVSMKDD